jgi:hypothetical protein
VVRKGIKLGRHSGAIHRVVDGVGGDGLEFEVDGHLRAGFSNRAEVSKFICERKGDIVNRCVTIGPSSKEPDARISSSFLTK